MALQVICKNCKDTITLKQNENTRPDLVRSIGETFQQQCSSCLATREYHVNEVNKRISRKEIAILAGVAGFVALGITVFAYVQGWFVLFGAALGISIFGISYSTMKKGERTFNRYRVRRTVT